MTEKMICSCCGREITKGDEHGPYNEDQYVCDDCWNNPALFFEDKIETSLELAQKKSLDLTEVLNQMEVIDLYLASVPSGGGFQTNLSWTNLVGNKNLSLQVLKFSQKGLPLFIGKIRPAELLIMSSVDQWNEAKLAGYQRERIKEKNREIKDFLKNCDLPIVPPIIASIKHSSFTSICEDYGKIEIPIIPGNISLIDGQQRTGGFYELFRELHTDAHKYRYDELEEKYNEFLNFEIPVLFIDPLLIIEKLKQKNTLLDVKPLDVERAFFFVINKTQKSVSSSLKDELAYLTISSGITGIPAIDKDLWRAELVPLVNELNREGSPLHGLINLGGSSGLRRPIPLASFVSSLKPLYDNPVFHSYSEEERLEFLKGYWGAVRAVFPYAFEEDKKYLLTKTVGMYPMNSLSVDILKKMIEDGKNPLSKEDVYLYVLLLKDIDWSVDSSEFTYYLGKKGTVKGYELLKKNFEAEIRYY